MKLSSVIMGAAVAVLFMACKKETPTENKAAVGFAELQMVVEIQPNTTGIDIPVAFPVSNNGWEPFVIEFIQAISTATYGEQFEFPTMQKQDNANQAFYDPELKPDDNLKASIPMTIHPEKITEPVQIVLKASYGQPLKPQLVIRLNPAQ